MSDAAKESTAAAVNEDASSKPADKSSIPAQDGTKGSREASPVRKNRAPGQNPSGTSKLKRKPSVAKSVRTSRETSPSRSVSAPALSKSSQNQTHHSSTSHQDLQHPRPDRPLPNAPHWPNSPRLTLPKSPGLEAQSSPRKKSEPAVPSPLGPSVVLQREGSDNLEEPEEIPLPSGMRTPRSNSSPALETVVESSLPSTPAIGTTSSTTDQASVAATRHSNKTLEDPEKEKGPSGRPGRTGSIASSTAPMSQQGSESESGYRSEEKPPTSAKAPPAKQLPRRPTVMAKDTSSKNMTVETETVSSVPQVALATASAQGGASVRSKKSTDTIKAPRKEKKKPNKRSTVGSTSNPSSKADIFAAKIAEAVDEANSSDSEETFVYESNPPEPSQRPASRFHSRTPSATSVHGGPDPRGQRLPLLSTIDGTQSTGRKGMKFVNNSLNKDSGIGSDGIAGDGAGSERGPPGSGPRDARHAQRERNGNSRHHNGHRSILADDNPFHRPSVHKASTHSLRHVANSHTSAKQTSTPPSPRHTGFRNGNLGNDVVSKKSSRWTAYEADGEGADDEQVPLISGRGGRSHRGGRRPGSGSWRQLEHNQQRRQGCVRTYAGCIVAAVTIILILTGIGGFLIATTNALQGVRVLNVTDVLVSKQEIMLDLVVEAVNPNAIAVTVGSMDVNLFAKSSHVREGNGDGDGDGDDDDGGWWSTRRRKSRRRNGRADGKQRRSSANDEETYLGRVTLDLHTTTQKRLAVSPSTRASYHISDGVDEGTDPPDDLPEQDKETMLLGRIFSFDSVLTFDASPFQRSPSVSTGELRLGKPGNKTEEGGTARWERVLQHPFELIVRGVLKYQLPLSGRTRTAPIASSVRIDPDDAPAEAE